MMVDNRKSRSYIVDVTYTFETYAASNKKQV